MIPSLRSQTVTLEQRRTVCDQFSQVGRTAHGSVLFATMSTYLLTWNPQRWPWDDLVDEARRLRHGKGLAGRWACGNARSLKPGDRFFFLRQGRQPRGIVGSGRITSAPRSGRHWDLERCKRGVLARYVDLRFEVLLDPEREAPLGVAELTRGPLSEVHWRTQISGIRIADDAAALLEKLWAAHVALQRASAKARGARPLTDAFLRRAMGKGRG